jgi:membrane-associated phospholipid phosphatase
MNNALYRLKQMSLGWGSVGLIYYVTDYWQGVGTQLQPGPIDHLISFNPHSIWLYMSFFLIIPTAYLGCSIQRIIWLRAAMQLSALSAGAIFLAWPTTLTYPPNPGSSLSSILLAALTRIDSAQNCFPSLHMALTVLAIWALHDAQRPVKNAMFWLWGLAIAFSIVQLRRHLFIDLLAGTTLGLTIGLLCQRCIPATSGLEEGYPHSMD